MKRRGGGEGLKRRGGGEVEREEEEGRLKEKKGKRNDSYMAEGG